MDATPQEHVAFHLTGIRIGASLDAPEGLGLLPALLAGYRDLRSLRYDFPLVLARTDDPNGCVRSLKDIVDGALQQAAPRGIEGERARKQALRVEQEIRALVAAGARGDLTDLWDTAAAMIGATGGKDHADSLAGVRQSLKTDGRLIDCSIDMPGQLFAHAWIAVQQARTRGFCADIERLKVKLADVLRGDYLRSEAGRNPDSLRASIGPPHAQDIDFTALSKLLAKSIPPTSLPAARRHRIETALEMLQSQRFFATAGGPEKTHSFVFDSCTAALDAFRRHLPEMVELIKAVTIAELEIEGRYIDTHHHVYFDEFDGDKLRPQDLNLFPGYLVCLRAGDGDFRDLAGLMEVLSLGIPVKVLVLIDDILEEPAAAEGHFALSTRTARLANMALGLNDVYVLQSVSSNLYRYRQHVLQGLRHPGRSLFCVYTGASGKASGLPPYLAAAAAMESRAFPAFVYDPMAGPDWASRFNLEGNPQPESDWPLAPFTYEDDACQRVTTQIGFTFADFVACDPRYANHLASVPRVSWNGKLALLHQHIDHATEDFPDAVPYLMMVDGKNGLRKVLVDDKLVLATRRCRDRWHMLRELGGIRNSHAERAVTREKTVLEAEKRREIDSYRREAPATSAQLPAATTPAPASAVQPATPAPASGPAPAEETRSDEAYVETPRCTTCNECTLINDRMFSYDENKQAYIKDVTAGTYRQLVEAAESCQVSIIHPGKPRDPNEAGLAELLKRAEPFL